MKFKKWQKECERILYEGNHPSFNVAQVTESEDYWKTLFEDGNTPDEAIQIAQEQTEATTQSRR